MTTMTVSEVLDRAAGLIEERGLAHGVFEHPDGSLCMLGAARVVVFGTAHRRDMLHTFDGRWDLYERVIDVMHEGTPDRSAVRYSDTHTAAEVVAILRSFAAAQREAAA